MTDREILNLARQYPFVSSPDGLGDTMTIDQDTVEVSIPLGNVMRVWDHMYSRWLNYVSGHRNDAWERIASTFRYGLQCCLEDALRLHPEIGEASPILASYSQSVRDAPSIYARSWARCEEALHETCAVMEAWAWQDLFYNVPDYRVWHIYKIVPRSGALGIRVCLDCEWNDCPPMLVAEREFPVDPDKIAVEYFLSAQCHGN